MDNYTLMRLSDNEEDDAVERDELSETTIDTSTAEGFTEEYKKKYSDIKTNIKEDW